MCVSHSQISFYCSVHKVSASGSVGVQIDKTGGNILLFGIDDFTSLVIWRLTLPYIGYFTVFDNDITIIEDSARKDQFPVSDDCLNLFSTV